MATPFETLVSHICIKNHVQSYSHIVNFNCNVLYLTLVFEDEMRWVYKEEQILYQVQES